MTESSAEKLAIVIGGGITGLSAAYYLKKEACEKNLPLRVLVVESESQLGGKVQTDLFDGFVMEKGPDSFLARKPAALNLCLELGLQSELVGTNPAARKTYILKNGKLHRIPAGLNIGIPTQFVPFATTGLLSVSAKIRAAMDLFMPRSEQEGDQSLGGFLARRLGNEVVDSMAEPLLAGIYAGDSRQLSLRATFPQFESLEKQHGSLIRGMLAQAKQAKAQSAARTEPQHAAGNEPSDVTGGATAGGAVARSETGSAPAAASGQVTSATAVKKAIPNTVFLSLRGGLSQLIETLADAVGKESILTNAAVRSVAPLVGQEGDAESPRYQVVMQDGAVYEAHTVIVTTPAYTSAKLLSASFSAAKILEKIPYSTVATVVLTYHKEQISFPLDGTGFVVPKKEGRDITACTWVSSKWLHTAPADKVLIRCYVGRAGEEAIVEEPDELIVQKVRKDLRDTMGISAEPIFTRITRWRKSMPQYTVGHLERIEEFEKQAGKQFPGLLFAGAGFTGLGLPDCIQQGKQAAENASRFLQD